MAPSELSCRTHIKEIERKIEEKIGRKKHRGKKDREKEREKASKRKGGKGGKAGRVFASLLALKKSPRIGGGGESLIFLSRWQPRDERRKARDN